MKPLTEKMANKVYDILVVECGANDRPDDRMSFVCAQSREVIHEWRFCGSLGFGGKFRRGEGVRGNSWKFREYMSVDCYQEDETPDRKKRIEDANKRLEAL